MIEACRCFHVCVSAVEVEVCRERKDSAALQEKPGAYKKEVLETQHQASVGSTTI